MLSLTTTFLFADQNLMAPNLTAIADSFGFSNEERDSKLGGQIAVGFFLVGAPVCFSLLMCIGETGNVYRFEVGVCVVSLKRDFSLC